MLSSNSQCYSCVNVLSTSTRNLPVNMIHSSVSVHSTASAKTDGNVIYLGTQQNWESDFFAIC